MMSLLYQNFAEKGNDLAELVDTVLWLLYAEKLTNCFCNR